MIIILAQIDIKFYSDFFNVDIDRFGYLLRE